MQGILVEMDHPKYGFERFEIKVIQKYNMKSDEIVPQFSRPKYTLSGLNVGRHVNRERAKAYVHEYFHALNLKFRIL